MSVSVWEEVLVNGVASFSVKPRHVVKLPMAMEKPVIPAEFASEIPNVAEEVRVKLPAEYPEFVISIDPTTALKVTAETLFGLRVNDSAATETRRDAFDGAMNAGAPLSEFPFV